MLDKLILLSRTINERYRKFATRNGQSRWGYAYVADLRKSQAELPAILYCGGLHNQRFGTTGPLNKIEIVGVAELGLRRTTEVVSEIIPDLTQARIYRLDLAVDIPGIEAWHLAEACFVPHAQNYRVYRTRGATSFYLQHSRTKKIVIYDKWKEVALKNGTRPELEAVRARFEIQLQGRAVPFKKFRNLHRYADLNLLQGVRFRRVIPISGDLKGLKLLAAYGLRRMIKKHGMQATAKLLEPAHWAYARKRLLRMAHKMPDVGTLLKESIEAWLNK